ncbi:hypothetical protein [Burkholderia sp. LMG 32019]|uniref:hypothetical protein n=1 Tax=Burkholderia sp. LMG 32019 TaxID=3158173 RepID=UPI003C2C1806
MSYHLQLVPMKWVGWVKLDFKFRLHSRMVTITFRVGMRKFAPILGQRQVVLLSHKANSQPMLN